MSKHIRSESIDKIYRIFNKIVNRLPQTFPRVALVVHTSVEDLQQYYIHNYNITEDEELPEELPFAFCDGNTYTVHVHLTMNEEKLQDITWYFLHELGHLYAHSRYGDEDPRWADFQTAEAYANRFANRWLRKLQDEGRVRL